MKYDKVRSMTTHEARQHMKQNDRDDCKEGNRPIFLEKIPQGDVEEGAGKDGEDGILFPEMNESGKEAAGDQGKAKRGASRHDAAGRVDEQDRHDGGRQQFSQSG